MLEPLNHGAELPDAFPDSEEFRLLVGSVVDYAIFLLDPDGIVLTWNRGAERLKGYRADEIIGQHYSVFYPEASRGEGLPQRLLAEARETGLARHSGWRVRQDGSRFWADVVITALWDDDGVLHGFGKVTRDTTELHLANNDRERALVQEREAVRRLEQLDGWRRDFIRSVTHDLQSPVLSLAGFADLLDEDELTPDERSEFIGRIRSNARSLQDMIDHLRTYVLLENDQVDLQPQPVRLEPFVSKLVSDMAPILSRQAVEIDIPARLAVDADRQALERILRNLLGNSVRHTGAGGTIAVTARSAGDRVSVAIRDTGEGIPEDVLPKVFDRFHRGPNGRTGLGLAIVKEYVELHGGTVRADSPPGEGATFTFTLPAAERAPS